MRARSPAFRPTALLSTFEEKKLLFLSCLVECRLQKTNYFWSNPPSTLEVHQRERERLRYFIADRCLIKFHELYSCCQGYGKTPRVAGEWSHATKKAKVLIWAIFYLPLAFKDLTLLLLFLLWFGFAHSMAFVD